jgi:dephospho-CoA kinase
MILPFPGGTAGPADPAASLSQCRRLARVLTQTQRMLELARDNDWDAVAEEEAERRDDLKRCFAEPVPPENGELVAEALAAVLHLNEELMACLASARDEVLRQGVAQARTRSAIDRYQDVKRGL